MICNAHNSLIVTSLTDCTSNRLGEGSSSEASDSEAENKKFLFVFNSICLSLPQCCGGMGWFCQLLNPSYYE